MTLSITRSPSSSPSTSTYSRLRRSLAVVISPVVFLSLAGWSACNTSYDSPVLDVTEAEIAEGFSRTVQCTRYNYVGGSDVVGSGSCHMQGISRFLGRTMTSCQDDNDDQGHLQLYPNPIYYYDAYGTQYEPTRISPTSMQGNRDHPAVGQALSPISKDLDEVLVPVVASSSKGTQAVVELRNGLGARECSFVHDAPTGSNEHLGAVALHSVKGDVYMAACNWDCDRLYIYELDPEASDCAPNLLSDSPVESDSSLREPIAGSSDKNWASYNSLSIFRNELGAIYMLAGHDGWLDTWRIDQPTSAQPTFHKVAKAKWGNNQAGHWWKDMLFEGMTLERVDSNSVDLWMAPHDYDTGGCDGRECTRAIYRCRLDL